MAFMDQAMQLRRRLLALMLTDALRGDVLYYALFEGLWGAAAGKALCRLRVVGPDRNPPGFARALLRALIYVALPFAAVLAGFGTNPKAYIGSSMAIQYLPGVFVLYRAGAAVCTARRRNGFAAVQDLVPDTG